MEILALTILFLISALVVVPISHRLNLGAVLGYLLSGILIGPSCLRLVWDTESIFHFSEFGVIFLMFVIGLELQPSRLWILRRSVFGLGLAQVVLTAALAMALGLTCGLSWQAALILGLGLAMSSTALVLQSLSEQHQLSAQHGRDAFAVLLFQDLAVIPILALLPVLGSEKSTGSFEWSQILIPLAVIIVFILVGRTLLKPAFKWIAAIENREMFTAASLLIVMGAAALMSMVGLSMGLGAFLAGVLLSDSEYRHELEADIEPFKGLLLGLFFIAIGMSAKVELLLKEPLKVLGLVLGLYLLKALVIYALKMVVKSHHSPARKLSVYLSQGGEFAFVLFAAAVANKVMEREISDLFIMVVTISMLLAPFLFMLEAQLFSKKLDKPEVKEFDSHFDEAHVVIAGFGRFGQIVGRLLALRKIPFTALDKSSSHVEFVRRFGNKIFYGDATRLDLLHAAKVGQARLFVLAIDNVEESVKTAELMKRHFPQVPIYARARNRFHCYKLMDLGIPVIYRDTFLSSIAMGKKVLMHMGLSAGKVESMVAKFQAYDEDLLIKQHAVYQNEAQLIQTSRQALSDLESLFESDSNQEQIS